MAAPLPPGISIETIFLIEATYAPDAAETRVPFRARHLARVAELRDAGIVIEAGACSDMSTSVLLVRAIDAEAAAEVARVDVYMRNGVWVELRVRPFGRVCRSEELRAPVAAR
jgi:uncharacterized protein YciI